MDGRDAWGRLSVCDRRAVAELILARMIGAFVNQLLPRQAACSGGFALCLRRRTLRSGGRLPDARVGRGRRGRLRMTGIDLRIGAPVGRAGWEDPERHYRDDGRSHPHT
jgi:hypothetical protein